MTQILVSIWDYQPSWETRDERRYWFQKVGREISQKSLVLIFIRITLKVKKGFCKKRIKYYQGLQHFLSQARFCIGLYWNWTGRVWRGGWGSCCLHSWRGRWAGLFWNYEQWYCSRLSLCDNLFVQLKAIQHKSKIYIIAININMIRSNQSNWLLILRWKMVQVLTWH